MSDTSEPGDPRAPLVSDLDALQSVQRDVTAEDRAALNQLLDLSEDITGKLEAETRSMWRAAAATAFGIFALVAVAIFYANSNDWLPKPAEGEGSQAILFLIMGGILAGFIGYYVGKLWDKRIEREARALKETATLVHEVFEALGPALSAVEVAQIKIRLARLDM